MKPNWIQDLPADAIASVTNARLDSFDDLIASSDFDSKHIRARADQAFRDALASVAPKGRHVVFSDEDFASFVAAVEIAFDDVEAIPEEMRASANRLWAMTHPGSVAEAEVKAHGRKEAGAEAFPERVVAALQAYDTTNRAIERLKALATRTQGSPGGAVDCAACGAWVDTTKALNPPDAEGRSYDQRFPYPLPMERSHRGECIVTTLESIIKEILHD